MDIRELYCIEFLNNKKYIGVSKNFKNRFNNHLGSVKNGSHLPIHNAIRKYGEENIYVYVCVIGKKEYIFDLERKAISFFKTRDRQYGYNVALGGETSPVDGIGHTKETKLKMSISQKKRIHTAEEIEKMTASLKGRIFTEDHLKKLKKPKSEQHKKNIGRALKGKSTNQGINNPMFGKHHSEETKQKIREKRLLQVFSEETLNKFKNKKISEETRRKMSESHKGKQTNWMKGRSPWNKGKKYSHKTLQKDKLKRSQPIIPEN